MDASAVSNAVSNPARPRSPNQAEQLETALLTATVAVSRSSVHADPVVTHRLPHNQDLRDNDSIESPVPEDRPESLDPGGALGATNDHGLLSPEELASLALRPDPIHIILRGSTNSKHGDPNAPRQLARLAEIARESPRRVLYGVQRATGTNHFPTIGDFLDRLPPEHRDVAADSYNYACQIRSNLGIAGLDLYNNFSFIFNVVTRLGAGPGDIGGHLNLEINIGNLHFTGQSIGDFGQQLAYIRDALHEVANNKQPAFINLLRYILGLNTTTEISQAGGGGAAAASYYRDENDVVRGRYYIEWNPNASREFSRCLKQPNSDWALNFPPIMTLVHELIHAAQFQRFAESLPPGTPSFDSDALRPTVYVGGYYPINLLELEDVGLVTPRNIVNVGFTERGMEEAMGFKLRPWYGWAGEVNPDGTYGPIMNAPAADYNDFWSRQPVSLRPDNYNPDNNADRLAWLPSPPPPQDYSDWYKF
jgi:hypothetical protein